MLPKKYSHRAPLYDLSNKELRALPPPCYTKLDHSLRGNHSQNVYYDFRADETLVCSLKQKNR